MYIQVFSEMSGVLAVAGWPYPARAVIAAERRKEYAEAAMASGLDVRGFCCVIYCPRRGA